MAPRKNKKKGVKVVELHINTHLIKVAIWGLVGFGACLTLFYYVPLAERMKPFAEAFFTAIFTKVGDAVHSD